MDFTFKKSCKKNLKGTWLQQMFKMTTFHFAPFLKSKFDALPIISKFTVLAESLTKTKAYDL